MNDISYTSNIEEVTQYLRKSTSWVYKHWQILGGRKLGGSLFFPSKEDLYEHLFCKAEGVEVRLHPEGNQVHRNLVQNEGRSNAGRSEKKGGYKKPQAESDGTDRHGLYRISREKTGSRKGI